MSNWLQQIADWFHRLAFWFVVRPWERGITVRCGRWVLDMVPGIHLRLPFLDEVFVQNVRVRVLNLPVQTVTNRSGETITVSAIVRWRIADVRLMYDKLHNPEDWIYNVVLSAIAGAVYETTSAAELTQIGEAATKALAEAETVGIEIQGVAITDIARVRTYRLITGEGNTGWSWSRVGALEAAQPPR